MNCPQEQSIIPVTGLFGVSSFFLIFGSTSTHLANCKDALSLSETHADVPAIIDPGPSTTVLQF